MNTHREHDCEENATEYTATPEQPYHYVGSGLSNVYLIGVKYWKCAICGQQSAELPSLTKLLESIARTIVEKPSLLIGEQVRFLRKRLGKSSKDFAALVGLTPQRYSAVENKAKISEGRDRLFRFIYRGLSEDPKLKGALSNGHKLEQWLIALHGERDSEKIIGTWVANRKWRVESRPLAYAA